MAVVAAGLNVKKSKSLASSWLRSKTLPWVLPVAISDRLRRLVVSFPHSQSGDTAGQALEVVGLKGAGPAAAVFLTALARANVWTPERDHPQRNCTSSWEMEQGIRMVRLMARDAAAVDAEVGSVGEELGLGAAHALRITVSLLGSP
jgi:hypothetical protein